MVLWSVAPPPGPRRSDARVPKKPPSAKGSGFFTPRSTQPKPRTERRSAVAEQGEHDEADDPERGKFPAAVLVGEEPAVLSVHEHDGARHQRDQQQRHPARLDSEQQ